MSSAQKIQKIPGYNATADALVDFMEKNNLPIPTEEFWTALCHSATVPINDQDACEAALYVLS